MAKEIFIPGKINDFINQYISLNCKENSPQARKLTQELREKFDHILRLYRQSPIDAQKQLEKYLSTHEDFLITHCPTDQPEVAELFEKIVDVIQGVRKEMNEIFMLFDVYMEAHTVRDRKIEKMITDLGLSPKQTSQVTNVVVDILRNQPPANFVVVSDFKNSADPAFSCRVGKVRIVFRRIDDGKAIQHEIMSIGFRKDVYRKLGGASCN